MAGMNLYKASRQWATRPSDERFATLGDLVTATKGYADAAVEAVLPYKDLRVVETDAAQGETETDLALVGPTGVQARFGHWSFGQLAARVGAPADYLRRLPSDIVAQNLNFGIDSRGKEAGDAKLLMHSNGTLMVRAFTSEEYARIWNWEVAERLDSLTSNGWRVPPARPSTEGQPGARAATAADLLDTDAGMGLSVKVGDIIAPAGLYASDHDMFVFLVNEQNRIAEPGNPSGLARGVFVENSEVGASKLRVTRFLYRAVCGNHIVWDAEKVIELSVRHVGDIDRKAAEFFATIREYADQSSEDDEAKVEHAMQFKLGDTKEQVLDNIFGKRILSRKQAAEAYTVAEEVENLDPKTAWGLAQGATRMATRIPFADKRNEMDRAAGRIIRIAF